MRRDTRTIQLRVPPHEGLVYERRAQAVGMSLSEWLRLLARRDSGMWTGQQEDRTMREWTIRSDAGVIMGTYEAETPDDALDAMARDAGYASQQDAVDRGVAPFRGSVYTRSGQALACEYPER